MARTPLLLAVTAASVLVSGCAQEAVTGQAAPVGLLDLPSASDVVPASEWPNACEFLSDGEIAALLPNQQGIERQPRPVEVLTDGTATNGSCDYRVSHGNDTWVTIGVSIETLGARDIVREQFASDKHDSLEQGDEVTPAPGDLGAEECYVDGSSYLNAFHCYKSGVQFKIHSTGYATVPGVDENQADEALATRLTPEVVKTIAGKIG